jgi:hypothetical protein
MSSNNDDDDDDGGAECSAPLPRRHVVARSESFPLSVDPDKIARWIAGAMAEIVQEATELSRRHGGVPFLIESSSVTSVPLGSFCVAVPVTMVILWGDDGGDGGRKRRKKRRRPPSWSPSDN